VTLEIRPIEAGDAAAWRALFLAYGTFYETEFSDDVLDRVWAQLVAADSGIDALVATDPEQGAELVGFAHFRSHPDTFSGHRDWYLDDLFVDPKARGGGIATALIARITDIARATSPGGVLRWITAEDNARAQRVYDRIAARTTWLTYEVRL
jgi:ribosomal protein S18 acetylase RimI-like enzyme